MEATSRSDCQSQTTTASEFRSEHAIITPYQENDPFEISEFSQGQILQPDMDFPMNWLPPDSSLAIDYDSIVGLGIGSLDFFALPNLDVSSTQNDLTQKNDGMAQGTTSLLPEGNIEIVRNNHCLEDRDNYLSSLSPHTMSPTEAPGGLYATSSDGARMPCTIRARRNKSLLPGAKPVRRLNQLRNDDLYEAQQGFAFPAASHILAEGPTETTHSHMHAIPLLSGPTYDEIFLKFRTLCLENVFGFIPYTTSDFPDIPSMNLCIRLYFENFDATMPILHEQVVIINDHWILALAVSAVGCQYAEADEYSQMVEPMHEFLRRAITVTANSNITANQDPHLEHHIAFAQARLLNQVGMLYSGSIRLLSLAKTQHSAMIELARSLILPALPNTSTTVMQFSTEEQSPQLTWRETLLEECKRRIVYSIWLLDCMAVYHFGQQLYMPPSMMSTPLPDDSLWRLENANDLQVRSISSMHKTSSLSSATIMLFKEKKVMAELGQFARVILLHGVYREIFQLKGYFARPLGSWVPSIQQQPSVDGNERPASQSISDRGESGLLHSWRNAALDCVDVLHWAANGTIALQAGAEHPTVLHLHLSRTIILAPFEQVQTLANSVASFAKTNPPATLDVTRRQEAVDAEREIIKWAQRDQCKARLAVLHSGCLFWHIRRYSCRAFYEPMAVFLATLTIWAYSSYISRTVPSSQESCVRENDSMDKNLANHYCKERELENEDDTLLQSEDEETEEAPTFIHLDRPNDDEIVQAFVRFGTASAMRANIAGVGDIYSAKGPARILREGRKILSSVSLAWGRTDKYFKILEVLEQVSSGRVALNYGRK